jgi:hypothetical protein
MTCFLLFLEDTNHFDPTLMSERQREDEHGRACDDLAGPSQGSRGGKRHNAEASGSGPSGRDGRET